MTNIDLDNRFTYHRPDNDKVMKHGHIRIHTRKLAEEVIFAAPDSRERDIALAKIEEAMFWANAAIAREPKDDTP